MATVTALTECVLLRMPKASIIRGLHDDPEFSELFTTYLMERILANYGKEDRPDPIVPKINQETLAEMIGTSRTHVNFFMNKFRQLGLIEYDGSDTKGEIKVNRSLVNMLLHEGRNRIARLSELWTCVRPMRPGDFGGVTTSAGACRSDRNNRQIRFAGLAQHAQVAKELLYNVLTAKGTG
jgi:hypothetical protein